MKLSRSRNVRDCFLTPSFTDNRPNHSVSVLKLEGRYSGVLVVGRFDAGGMPDQFSDPERRTSHRDSGRNKRQTFYISEVGSDRVLNDSEFDSAATFRTILFSVR